MKLKRSRRGDRVAMKATPGGFKKRFLKGSRSTSKLAMPVSDWLNIPPDSSRVKSTTSNWELLERSDKLLPLRHPRDHHLSLVQPSSSQPSQNSCKLPRLRKNKLMPLSELRRKPRSSSQMMLLRY